MLSASRSTEAERQALPKQKVSIAIPASVVSDTPHLREKTSKIGLIGRAAAIFRIDEIIIYPDNPKANQAPDMGLIALLLSYMETPQYLRKKLFRLNPDLQYVGILPPLRTPHHPLNRQIKKLKVGDYREGVTLSKTSEGLLVDIGVEQPALIQDKQLPVGQRVTVKIVAVDKRVKAEQASRDEIPECWGYSVSTEKQSFGKMVNSRCFDLTVATSKLGQPFNDVADGLAEKWKKTKNVLVALGAPAHGLHAIVEYEGLNLDKVVDFVVNTIPKQGTETVRTEEALIASLAVLRSSVFKA